MADVQQLMDSLQRVVDVSTQAGNAMEALATAMNDKVKEVKGGKSEFFNLIDDKDKKVEQFAKHVKDLPAVFKALAGDIDTVQKKLKETADALDKIKANAKGGGGGGTATASSGDCPCETILNAIKGSVAAVASTVAGNGIRLESRAMTVLDGMHKKLARIANDINRMRVSGGGLAGSAPSGRYLSPPVRAKTVAETPEPKAGPVEPGSAGEEGTKNVLTEASKASGNVDKEADRLVQQWLGTVRTLYWAKTYFDNAVSSIILKMSKDNEVQADSFERMNFKLESYLSNIASSEKEISVTKRRALREEMLRLKALEDAGAKTEQLQAQYKKIYDMAKKINREIMGWKAADAVAGVLGGALKNYVTGVTGGLLKDLNEWEKEATNMAATMTSSIHKAGGESKVLVAQYRDLLKVSDEVIRDTHQFPGIVRKEWLKAIKKGTRSLTETKSVINSAMAAAWQVGANAEATADEFQKWNMQVGMTIEGGKSLARTMSTVSKVTGVMGDNLLLAVQAAREIAQQMRDTGIYSQQTANAVVGWMASAQKFGIDKQVQNIFRASQGGLEAFNEASAQTRNLLASSGQLQNVLGGNADPDAVMQGVGNAIRQAIPANAFPRNNRMAGIPDLKKLSKAEIARLDLIMKRRFGMKLGEAVRMLEGIQDQNPEEKLAEINRQLSDVNDGKSILTKAELENLEMQKKQLEIAVEEKKLTKNLDSLAAASDALKDLPADGAARTQALNRIFQQNKLNEATLRETTKSLDEKLKRQGKTFDVMGKDAGSFAARMNELLPAVRSGDVNAIREFREMQAALADANKKADSEAKNNSNNIDKMESDQQRLQNALQNLAKPLHTMAMQAPIWTWYLAMISGAVWALYRAWSKGRLAENMALTAQTLVSTIGTKGSGWVHDPYVEHVARNIDKNLAIFLKQRHKLGVRTASTMQDSTNKKLGAFGDALENTKSKLQGLWDSFTGMLPQGVKDRLNNAKDMAVGAVSDKLSKMKEKLGWKQVKADQKILSQNMTPSSAVPVSKAGKIAKSKAAGAVVKKPKLDGTFKPEGGMASGAAKLAAIAAGVIALGVILVAAAKAIMAMTGFDAKQAKEVAWVIGVVIGAGAGALLAAAGAAEIMKYAQKTIGWGDIANIYQGGLLLLAILPAVIILGAVILGLGALLSLVMSPKKAQECAMAVGVILLAASIVAAAVLVAAVALTILGALSTVAVYLAPLMLLGAAALLILTPGIIGLAGAVLYIAEKTMKKYVNPEWAKKVSGQLAEVMKSAAIVAGSVLASAAALSILGILSIAAGWLLLMMLLGARTLLLLTPAIIRLAGVVIWMAEKAIKDVPKPEDAAKTSKAVADILWAAGKIAMAVLGGAAALSYLGALILTVIVMVPLMMLGAAALLALTPAVITLAKAVIDMAGKLAKKIDVEEGKKTAENTASILDSAGSIAWSVLKSMAYMAVLGGMVLIAPFVAAQMLLGAAALVILTYAVVSLAKAVIGIASRLATKTDVEEGKKTAENTASVLKSATDISWAVLKGAAYLTALGAMVLIAPFVARMMSAGAIALILLTPAVISVAKAIIDMANRLATKTDAKSGTEAAKNLAELLQSTYKIAEAIDKARGFLSSFAGMSFFGRLLKKWMYKGADALIEMSSSVLYMLKSIIDLAQSLGDSRKVRESANSLKAVMHLLDEIPKFIEGLAARMQKFSNAKFWNFDLNQKTQDFAWWFYGISFSLSEGIFKPIMSFPKEAEIQTAMDSLTALVDSLDGLMDIMYNLSEILEEMGSIGIDFSALEDVGGIFKGGRLELVINAKNQGGFGGEDYMDKLLGVFTGVRSPSISGNNGLLRGMKKGFGQAIEKPIGGVQRDTRRVGTGVNRLGGTMSRLNTTSGDIPSKIDAMKDMLHTDLVAIINQLRAPGGQPAQQGQQNSSHLQTLVNNTRDTNLKLDSIMASCQRAANSLASLNREANNGNSLDTHDHSLEDIMMNKVLPHIENMAAVAVAQEEVAVKGVVDNGELDRQVQARVENSRPSEAMMTSMEYLAAIAANTAATNESVQEAVEVLEDIKDLMGKSQGGEATPATQRSKPRGSPNYYSWQFGRFGDTSAKQYNNPGRRG